jgi:hypothetical protein
MLQLIETLPSRCHFRRARPAGGVATDKTPATRAHGFVAFMMPSSPSGPGRYFGRERKPARSVGSVAGN